MKTFFSIIIPSYNEAVNIRQCIESVLYNDMKEFSYEIIVIDNGSTDGTVRIVKDLGIKIIGNNEGKRKPIAALRNTGARLTQGDILAFLDADMVVPTNWLQTAKKYFDKVFSGALGFIECVPDTAGWVGKTWGNRLYQKLDKTIPVDFLPGRNIFINRKIFDEIKGFNENLITGEDKDLTLRVVKAGYKVISVSDITVVHLGYEKNLWEFLKKEFWRQGSTLILAKQNDYSFRTLRNPILSLWHISLPFIIISSIFYLNIYITGFLIILWLLPSAYTTVTKIDLEKSFSFSVSFFFLTFLRWNVSGLALLWQLLKIVQRNR